MSRYIMSCCRKVCYVLVMCVVVWCGGLVYVVTVQCGVSGCGVRLCGVCMWYRVIVYYDMSVGGVVRCGMIWHAVSCRDDSG